MEREEKSNGRCTSEIHSSSFPRVSSSIYVNNMALLQSGPGNLEWGAAYRRGTLETQQGALRIPDTIRSAGGGYIRPPSLSRACAGVSVWAHLTKKKGPAGT